MKAIAAFLDEIDGHTPVAFQIGFRLFLLSSFGLSLGGWLAKVTP